MNSVATELNLCVTSATYTTATTTKRVHARTLPRNITPRVSASTAITRFTKSLQLLRSRTTLTEPQTLFKHQLTRLLFRCLYRIIRLTNKIQNLAFKAVRALGDMVFLDKFLKLSKMLLRKLRNKINEVAALNNIEKVVAQNNI